MRKLKKISAVLLATALFANPCLGSQYLQDVHAEETAGEESAIAQETQTEAEKAEAEKTAGENGGYTEKDVISESTETESSDPDDELSTAALSAESQQITVDLYFQYYEEYISLPDGYENSYQIVLPADVTGDIQYQVDGDSAIVDENGIITPRQYYANGTGNILEYSPGQSTVHVTCGSYTQTIIVNVIWYDEIYVNETLDKIYNDITSGKTLTETELAMAFTQYTAEHYSYSTSSSSLYGIIMTGAGDCWANTALVNALCQKAGIDSRIRYAANDSLAAGSGHRNSIIKADGKYYIADAGFTGNAPRTYVFGEEPEGLCIKYGNTLTQYDAFETDAIIPETVDGNKITALRGSKDTDDNEESVFSYGVKVTSISLPKTITDISSLAFQNCNSLAQISVDKENPNYMSIDGILYTRDGKVVRVPQTITDVILSDRATAIDDYAFSGNKASKITIPAGVTTIGSTLAFQGCESLAQISVDKGNPNYMSIDGILYTRDGKVLRVPQTMTDVTLSDRVTAIDDYAFSGNTADEITIPNGVTTIGFAAFWESRAEVITVPESVTAIGDHAFETTIENVAIKGVKGSYAEKYAADNGLTFIDIEIGNYIVEEIAKIKEKLDAYSKVPVKSSDKASLEELITEINRLLELSLTESQRWNLRDLRTDCEKYLSQIAEVVNKITELTETVNGYMAEKPESLNKDAVNQTYNEISALLIFSGNLTDEEKTTLNTLKTRCAELLTNSVKKGDIDKNGKINLTDLMLCLNHVAKKNILKDDAFLAADVDGNGTVNLTDLMRILNYVSKKSTEI